MMALEKTFPKRDRTLTGATRKGAIPEKTHLYTETKMGVAKIWNGMSDLFGNHLRPPIEKKRTHLFDTKTGKRKSRPKCNV